MLKKLSHIAFACIYFLLSVGIGYSQHFCGGELKSTSIIAKDLSCCCDSNEDVLKADCCYETSVYYQISDEQVSVSAISVPAWSQAEQVATHYQYDFNGVKAQKEAPLNPPNAPPLFPPQALYKAYCSLIFYG